MFARTFSSMQEVLTLAAAVPAAVLGAAAALQEAGASPPRPPEISPMPEVSPLMQIIEAMRRPVTVDLANATARAAAAALSRAGGIAINTTAVTTDQRMRVVARDIPLAHVLQALATNAGLLIAPTDAQGIRLFPIPRLEVGDTVQDIPGPFPPWSAEWGVPPPAVLGLHGMGMGMGGMGMGGMTGGGMGMGGMGMGGMTGGMTGGMVMGGFGGTAPMHHAPHLPNAAGTLHLALGANLLVVAEPGFSPAGEPGYWLTTYRVRGAALTRASVAFHASPRAASPMSLPPSGGSGRRF
jgi:hypothetical protein